MAAAAAQFAVQSVAKGLSFLLPTQTIEVRHFT